MSNKIYAITVLLEVPTEDEEVESLIAAIKQFRNVIDVQPHVAKVEMWGEKEPTGHELLTKLTEILYPGRKG